MPSGGGALANEGLEMEGEFRGSGKPAKEIYTIYI